VLAFVVLTHHNLEVLNFQYIDMHHLLPYQAVFPDFPIEAAFTPVL
jgi:hypothetical protein